MIMHTQENSKMEDFRRLLKTHSLKATPQRLAVHEAMLSLGHACVDMVTERIKETSSTKVTVASVYNILTHLALLGIYQHRMSANNKMYFDVNTFKHIHFYDTENHEFKDIMDDKLVEAVELHLSRKKIKGYKIKGFDIHLIGAPSKRNVRKAANK